MRKEDGPKIILQLNYYWEYLLSYCCCGRNCDLCVPDILASVLIELESGLLTSLGLALPRLFLGQNNGTANGDDNDDDDNHTLIMLTFHKDNKTPTLISPTETWCEMDSWE